MRARTRRAGNLNKYADPTKVFRFLVNTAHLPRWAVGFSKGGAADGNRLVVTTGASEADDHPRLALIPASGVVDFVHDPGAGVEVRQASSRVLARELGQLSTSSPGSARPACRRGLRAERRRGRP